MRHLLLIVLAVLVISCKELEIVRYEYQTSTQMGRTVFTATKDSVIVAFNGRGEPSYWAREITSDEWNALNVSMENVQLAEVSNLQAPSNARATDRAPFAKFNFVGKDSTISSADFDAGQPHEMLMPLMECFIKMEENNNK